ncbi:RNA polymerase sigma factor [Ekhidna sp.]|uniref:RNA polymerase sigma factor n=1 Tax=Ekhidna sp. TaxID=2608089 RepID=UPI003C7CB4C2
MPNNTELFETLHADYYGMVNQMCMGFMKGNKDLAQDLTQEAFINTWRALDKFKGASSYKTWIYRITVNTCLKYIRDNKVKEQTPIEDQMNLANESDNTEHEHSELYRAIGQLGEVDRLIIMMVLEELDYYEIAEVVGISEGNLRVKIHRIKKNLKKTLTNE